MDRLPLAFIGGMILLGGLSAFVADILGYKIGKKRLSIWHIRPKYVARTSVTVAGMLIPLFSVLVLTALSADFRTWVTKGRAAIAEAQQKTAEVAEKNQQLGKINSDLKLANIEKGKLQTGLAASKKAAEAQAIIAKSLSSTIERQKTNLSRLQSAVTNAARSMEKSKRENSKTLTLLSKTKTLLDGEKRHLQDIQKLFNSTLNERNLAESDKKKALEDFDKLNSANLALQANNVELSKTLEELQKRLPELTTEIEKLKEERTQADRDLADLDNKIDAASRLVLQIQRENSTYSTFSRQSSLMFLRGEELGRIIVPGNLSESEARNIVLSLLRLTRSAAIAKGAKPDLNYPFTQETGLLENRPDRSEMTNAEAENLWVKRIQGSRETRLLVARAATNRFSGEPVTLELSLYPNPIVFRAREVIAEGRADGREPDQVIFAQIRDFVKTYVNAKARRVKMIPVTTRDGESFGELTAETLFQALGVIRSTGRQLRLQAVATRDIRAGEQLEFELVVR